MNLRFGQTIANKTSLGKHTQLNKIDIWKPTQVDLYYTCANVDQLVPRVEINKHMGQLHDVESSFGSFLARTDDSVNHLPPRNVMSSLHTWMVFKHGKHMGGCITWVATCCNTTILPTVCWVSKSWDPNKNKQTNKRLLFIFRIVYCSSHALLGLKFYLFAKVVNAGLDYLHFYPLIDGMGKMVFNDF